MGRGPTARCRARGGEGIQASRQARGALTIGALAVAVLAVAGGATTAAVDEPGARWIAGGACAIALVVLAVGLLLRRPQVAGISVALVGGAYALGLAVDDAPLDVAAPLYAAALLLSCELALWSHQLLTSSPGEAGMVTRHAAWLGVLLLGVLAVGAVLIALVDVARTEGVAIDALGAAAALASVAVLLRAARPARER